MVNGLRRTTHAGGSPLRATLFVLFLALASLIHAESGPDTRDDTVAETLAGSGFSTDAGIAISALFERAAAEGVPPELLLPRLQEGVAKRVDADLVREALSEEILYLTTARDAIQRLPGGAVILDNPSSWSRAANFIRSGQSEETLFLVARASVNRPETFRPATLLYLSISEWGIEQDKALVLVEAVAASSLGPEAYPEVTGLLADAQRARLDLGEAALQIAEQLRAGRSVRQIARILRR
jgi:hypothetical protein